MLHAAKGSSVVQIEVGQLDSTIGINEVPFGNMTYWFRGTKLYININLTQVPLQPAPGVPMP